MDSLSCRIRARYIFTIGKETRRQRERKGNSQGYDMISIRLGNNRVVKYQKRELYSIQFTLLLTLYASVFIAL